MSFTDIVIKKKNTTTFHHLYILLYAECTTDVENSSARCLCTDLGELILIAIL